MANIQPMEPENEKQGEFEEYDRPSKSSVKRDMLALQDLGKTLCEMPFDKVKRAPIGERLLIEIAEFHKCKSFGAKKRQMQFIGKLMRDEEHEEVQAWVNGETVEQKLKVLHLHAAEQWRDRLIEDPGLLATFIESYPAAARENLNPIIRQAVQERAAKKAPRNFRQLFQIIYRLIEEKAEQDADRGEE
ncbi:ribosome biogenesis factor YjgA [Limnobacter parvus]|nr:ribosome biogenesis factor YjgA [Limnobacter parvus]